MDAMPVKLSQYKVTVTPTLDVLKSVHLPMAVFSWCLPIAGLGHIGLALLLQLQEGAFCFRAGELLALLAFGVGFAACLCAACGDAIPPQRRENLSHHMKLVSCKTLERLKSKTGHKRSQPRQRRLNIIWQKLTGREAFQN